MSEEELINKFLGHYFFKDKLCLPLKCTHAFWENYEAYMHDQEVWGGPDVTKNVDFQIFF